MTKKKKKKKYLAVTYSTKFGDEVNLVTLPRGFTPRIGQRIACEILMDLDLDDYFRWKPESAKEFARLVQKGRYNAALNSWSEDQDRNSLNWQQVESATSESDTGLRTRAKEWLKAHPPNKEEEE